MYFVPASVMFIVAVVAACLVIVQALRAIARAAAPHARRLAARLGEHARAVRARLPCDSWWCRLAIVALAVVVCAAIASAFAPFVLVPARPASAVYASALVDEALDAAKRAAVDVGVAFADDGTQAEDFLRQLTFDWSDPVALKLNDPPPHALGVRLQGSDPARVAVVADAMLDTLLGPFRASNLLDLDLATLDGASVQAAVDGFLGARKLMHRDELAVVVCRNVNTAAAGRTAMALKDHVYLHSIPLKTSADMRFVSSHGVAFLFLGGDLPADACGAADIQAHDSATGWDDNMLGRIRFRIKLC